MQYFDMLCWKNDLNSFLNVVIFSVETIWSPFYLEIEGLFIFSFQGRGLLMKNNTTHLQVVRPLFSLHERISLQLIAPFKVLFHSFTLFIRTSVLSADFYFQMYNYCHERGDQ